MTTERLLELKAELEAKLVAVISQEDEAVIAEKVKEYENSLRQELENRYSEDRKYAESRIDFINELIALDEKEKVEEVQLDAAPSQESLPEEEPLPTPEAIMQEVAAEINSVQEDRNSLEI